VCSRVDLELCAERYPDQSVRWLPSCLVEVLGYVVVPEEVLMMVSKIVTE
jgi:hypothetical protein